MAKAMPVLATDPSGSLADNAPLMLHTRLAELYRWSAFIADPVRVDELHAMRIAAKRLRYTMEIFAPAFDSPEQLKEFDVLYDKIKSIQEQIGDIHDSDVRAPLLQEFLEQHGDARPEIRIGLQRLIDDQHAARAKNYQNFLTSWNKLQKQSFRRRFLQLLAMDVPESDKENTPRHGKDRSQPERHVSEQTPAA